MASGVKINKECDEIFQQVKMNTKSTKKRKFTVLKISDDFKEIVPDGGFDRSEICDFKQLLTFLPPDDGRYVIYDYAFNAKSGADTSKLILVMWVPQSVTIKKKMLYASSKNYVKSMINEELPEFQCDCCDDISEDDILAKVRK